MGTHFIQENAYWGDYDPCKGACDRHFGSASRCAMTVLVIGSSSKTSIGYEIASTCARAGKPVIITSRRRKFLEKLESEGFETRYLDYPASCEALSSLPILSGVVFCLAKTDVRELRGGLVETIEENFHQTMIVNCFALIDLTRRLRPGLAERGSIIALTFFGSSTVIPGYGLMGVAKAALEQTIRTLACELGGEGVRVNGISAAAVPTVSSRPLPGFGQTSKVLAENSFLRRRVDPSEIASAAMWLLSDESGGVTGEVIQVNGGIRHALGSRMRSLETSGRASLL
jgi:enoyl-[acyl-carrier protein] reductase I